MRFVLTTALLWGMWCLLSGKFDALHLGAGLGVALLVAAACQRWQKPRPLPVLRLLGYAPWLMWEVIKSNLHVARLVLSHPMRINPRFVRMDSPVKGHRAVTLLGCSITLTPGTVTVEADGDKLLVHALDEHAARGLLSGEMSRRVRHVFAAEKAEAQS
jgi:multicomponent Na+:H+ antiporter subunit E